VASQALVIALVLLVASQYLFVARTSSRVLTTVTLILVGGAGIMLVKSVKREIEQRQQIEKLAKNLERANAKLKVLDKMKSEFVSIASHQLRSPLTSIRGYASMLLDGSYGKLSPKVGEAIEHISDASRFMASSVEDYLNVSRIQAGNMKYEYSDFNLKDIAERVADDTRQSAIHKGLLLTFKSDIAKKGIVHADVGKTRQIVDNLVNNSLKYTPQGSIQVFVHDDPRKKRIFVDVIDTGIGMAAHTIESLFEKFERAHNANEVNVTGTGLGLYIARKMARDMGGDVTAHSEGEGKGSTFTLMMPEVL
jgi:signal transduction histidine kinase